MTRKLSPPVHGCFCVILETNGTAVCHLKFVGGDADGTIVANDGLSLYGSQMWCEIGKLSVNDLRCP